MSNEWLMRFLGSVILANGAGVLGAAWAIEGSQWWVAVGALFVFVGAGLNAVSSERASK